MDAGWREMSMAEGRAWQGWPTCWCGRWGAPHILEQAMGWLAEQGARSGAFLSGCVNPPISCSCRIGRTGRAGRKGVAVTFLTLGDSGVCGVFWRGGLLRTPVPSTCQP